MARFSIGSIPFSISPVSIMKCFIGIGWIVKGSKVDLSEYQIFSDEFFPFLINQDNEMLIERFCEISTKKIDEIMGEYNLKSDLATKFSQHLKNTLNNQVNKRNASHYAYKYTKWLTNWINSPFGQVADGAVKKIEEWGVHPLQKALGAAASFGNAVYGKYVPSLQAVCVQMDIVFQSKCPELQFMETLLHEEIHTVVHFHMGEDEKRCELTWLNELAAVLTSQYAIESAAKELQDIKMIEQVKKCLVHMRSKQEYGELADAVLDDTKNPLIAWRAWEQIFKLSQDQKRYYSRENSIKPILHNLGWYVEFPYRYSNKYVRACV